MGDLTAVASAILQADVSNQISMAVAKKSLDAQRQEGQAAIALLKAAVQTGPGASGVAGLGETIDFTA